MDCYSLAPEHNKLQLGNANFGAARDVGPGDDGAATGHRSRHVNGAGRAQPQTLVYDGVEERQAGQDEPVGAGGSGNALFPFMRLTLLARSRVTMNDLVEDFAKFCGYGDREFIVKTKSFSRPKAPRISATS